MGNALHKILICMAVMGAAATAGAVVPAWGDLGDGMLANPVLNADYSDPDIVRIGDRYYLTCSEFHFMGMPVLESEDLVNWKIVGQMFDRIDLPGYSDMTKYAEGTWAPALKLHDGKVWMYVCTPEELSIIQISRCRRISFCRSRVSPYQ